MVSSLTGLVSFKELIPVRIGAEHFDEAALFLQVFDCPGHFAVVLVAFAIDKEIIFPGFALAGARFDFGHVKLETRNGASA